MTEIDAKMVSSLRKQTGAPMMDCKAALIEANADMQKAVEVLRKKGLKSADAKGDREVTEGMIFSYIHPPGKLGVLVEIACETDFVARNDEFQRFGTDICMHVAAMKPQYLTREEVPPEALEREREVVLAQTQKQMAGKPEDVIQKAVDGRMARFFADYCLLEQPFVKDDNATVEELLKRLIAKTGENMRIRRFVRLELGG
jgi:elongation factor Ts